jgi:hypothetical protein
MTGRQSRVAELGRGDGNDVPLGRDHRPRPRKEGFPERYVDRAPEVALRECCRWPYIHRHRFPLECRAELRLGKGSWLHGGRRADGIDALHAREIRGRIGLSFQNTAHERGFALRLQRPVGDALIAERTLWHRTQRLSARRARTVAGPDLQMVRQRLEAPERRMKLAGGSRHAASHAHRPFEQVRSPDVADKEEIAGDEADG